MGMPAQICVSNFQPVGNQLLGLFVNVMPAQICVSNFQPGGAQFIGTLRKWGSRPKSAYAIFSRGTISYWDFS